MVCTCYEAGTSQHIWIVVNGGHEVNDHEKKSTLDVEEVNIESCSVENN